MVGVVEELAQQLAGQAEELVAEELVVEQDPVWMVWVQWMKLTEKGVPTVIYVTLGMMGYLVLCKHCSLLPVLRIAFITCQ